MLRHSARGSAMTTASDGLRLRPCRRRLRRAWSAAAALGSLLLAAAPAAAEETPCDTVAPAGWGHHMVPAYQFSFLSRVQGRGANAHYLHCVRNNHRRRA